jgi:hypothetical protein
MLIKIPIYFDVDGKPSPEVLQEFIKDLQVSVTILLKDHEDLIELLNDSRESESFPVIMQVVDHADMMLRILKPKSPILVEPSKKPRKVSVRKKKS